MVNVHITPPPISPQAMGDLLCTIMLLCRGRHPATGKNYWAYMCIKPSMAQAFMEARAKGGFNLEEYGTVIEWGEGEDAPLDVKTRMQRDYGANHNYEADLLAAIEQQKKKYNF